LENDPSEFHDVVFSVIEILPGQIIRGNQQITARVSLVLQVAEVEQLITILQEYKRKYVPGAGPVTFTAIGYFR
jgi:hypothetical protein